MIARLAFAALFLLPSLTQAQAVFRPWTHGTPQSAGASYTGPCDIASVTPVGFYGLRACGASDATGSKNAIQVRRADNNSTFNILITSAGDLDTATAATDCSGTTCYITTEYCLGGCTANAIQSTAANQPGLQFSCNGSHPCISHPPTIASYLVATITSRAQPYTFGAVAYSLNVGAYQTIIGSLPNTYATMASLEFANTAGDFPRIICGINATTSPTSGVAAGNWFGANGICNGTSSFISVNGTEATSSDANQTDATYTTLTPGARFDAGNSSVPMNGYIEEYYLFPGGMTTGSGGTARAVCHNQSLYWGGFTC